MPKIDYQETFSYTAGCGYTCSGTKGKFDILWKLHKKKCERCNKKEIGIIRKTINFNDECEFKKFGKELTRFPF
jgi:hypothetical protein